MAEGNKMVTIIIPAYNCEATIEEAVASVFCQNTDVVDEIVIAEDCSTDGTRDVLRKIAAKYLRLRVLFHKTNRGGGSARNTAVDAARSDYVFCLDSDNVLETDSLASLTAFAQSTDADVAAFRELHYFRETTERVSHKWRFKEGQILLRDHLSGGIVPAASGNYLFKRSAWQEVGGYPESSGALDCWGFGLRLLGADKRMMVMEHGHYYHRYGLNSYWVRDFNSRSPSRVATALLRPYFHKLSRESVEFIERNQDNWMRDLSCHPLKDAQGMRGENGMLLRERTLRFHLHRLRNYLKTFSKSNR